MRNPFAFRLSLIVLAVLGLLFGFAVAEGIIELPPIPSLDLEQWAKDTAVLAAVVVFLVAIVRKWIWHADGAIVPILSVGLGMLIGAALGQFTDWLPTAIAGLSHGFAAGILASGGVDAIRGVLKLDKGTSDPDLPASNRG